MADPVVGKEKRAEWFEAMREFYARLDAMVAMLSVSCKGCGECCHFDVVEHLLYASELERRYLAVAGDILPENPDADGTLLDQGRRCPYQSGGQCHAREGRVLGCRLHFCIWPEAAVEENSAEEWHRALMQLHDKLGVAWNYRRLLPLSGQRDL